MCFMLPLGIAVAVSTRSGCFFFVLLELVKPEKQQCHVLYAVPWHYCGCLQLRLPVPCLLELLERRVVMPRFVY